MPRLLINIGAQPNDFTGDPLRVAFDKINKNFEELYGQDEGVLTADEIAAIQQANAPSALNVFVTQNDIADFVTGAYVDTAISAIKIDDGDYGDITLSGNRSVWTINDNAIITSKIVDGAITDTKIAGVDWSKISNVPVFDGSTGMVPASDGGTTTFLRADGTWVEIEDDTVTTSNLLTKDENDVIKLGGSSTEDTILSLGSRAFQIVDNSTYAFGRGSYFTYGGFHLSYGDVTNRVGQFNDLFVDTSGFIMQSRAADGQNVAFHLRGSAAQSTTFFDNRTIKRGIQYATNGYVTQDTSLADKKYVDDKFNAVSSYDVFTGTEDGLVPASGGGFSNFLRADGTWAEPFVNTDYWNITGVTDITDFAVVNASGFESSLSSNYSTSGLLHQYLYDPDNLSAVFQISDPGIYMSVSATGWSTSSIELGPDGIQMAGPVHITGLSADNALTRVLVEDSTTGRLFYRSASTIGGISDGDRGDITVSNSGSTWTIDDGAITTTKIADSAITTAKINNNSVVNSKINSVDWSKLFNVPVFNGSAGIVPASSGGTSTFLRADGAWAVAGITDGDKGDITVSGGGSIWTIDSGAISTSKIADSAITTAKINNNSVTNSKINSVDWSKITNAPSIPEIPTLDYGTYTPSVLYSEFITSASPNTAQYLRIGSVVTVSGTVWIDPSVSSPEVVTLVLSLPIASGFTNSTQLAGNVSSWPDGGETGAVTSDAANNGAGFTIEVDGGVYTSIMYVYQYTYRIV